MITIRKISQFLLSALLLACINSCLLSDSPGDQYLNLHLSESLKDYHRVEIVLVSNTDSNLVYDTVWNAALPDPASFPKYKLKQAKDKDFVIRIRAYNAAAELVMAKDMEIKGRKPQPPKVKLGDRRLFALSPSQGELSPSFRPEVVAYSITLPDSARGIAFTVLAMDSGSNGLTVNANPAGWGPGQTQALQVGPNSFDFKVKDKGGSESKTYLVIVTVGVDSTAAPLVEITSPKDGDFTNQDSVVVSWTVDKVPQTEKTLELLGKTDGVKTIIREKEGVPGKVGRAEIQVTRDTEPPQSPKASAATPTENTKPEWKWITGGGGNGKFRFKLDTATLAGAAESTLLTYTPPSALTPGTHRLYLQERDEAGNWSPTDSFAVTILAKDDKAPGAPILNGTTPTNSQPKWTWSPAGADGSGDFEYKLGDSIFTSGATKTRDTSLTLPGTAVSGTTYTLYVREKDSVDNWSKVSSLAIHFDATKPSVAIQAPQSSGIHITIDSTVTLSGLATGPNPITKVTFKAGAAAPANAVLQAGNWNTGSITVPEGSPFVVVVTAEDQAGNTAEAPLTILRDNTPPSAPILSDTPSTPTRVRTGSWSWTAGSDGAKGSGLSGRYRYNLNGKAWVETNSNLVNGLALVEGSNVFSVQEQDRASNWSASDQSTVRVDTTQPVLAITSPAGNPVSLSTAKITLAGSAGDTGSGVASVSISGQTAGSAATTLSGATWTGTQLTLKQGENKLVVTATDKVGNASAITLVVNVSVGTPAVTITFPPANYATMSDSIHVKYTVDGGSEQSAKKTLAVGSNTLTVESAANEVGVKGSANVIVLRDNTAPNAPIVSAPKLLTNGNPVWIWISNGDVGGGAGLPPTPKFRYALNGAAPVELSVLTHQIAGAAEAGYAFSVQEQDRAGNWSAASATVTVRVDKTAPVITITSPANGYITNRATDTIRYTEKDGTGPVVNKQQVVTLANDNGVANSFTISSVADSATNVGTGTITLYRRSNVLFVRSVGQGKMDGSSWANCFGHIQGALAASVAGTHLWVAGGNYSSSNGDKGYPMKNNMHFYGGFSNAGTANKITDRTFGAADTTNLENGPSGDVIISALASDTAKLTGLVVDGFKLIQRGQKFGIAAQYASITMRNLKFVPMVDTVAVQSSMYMAQCTIIGENLKFERLRTLAYPVLVTDNVSFKNIEFKGVKIPNQSATILCDGILSVVDSYFRDPVQTGAYHINIGGGTTAKLTITNNSFKAPDLARAVNSGTVPVTASGNVFVP